MAVEPLPRGQPGGVGGGAWATHFTTLFFLRQNHLRAVSGRACAASGHQLGI